jgi:hypothetical protein
MTGGLTEATSDLRGGDDQCLRVPRHTWPARHRLPLACREGPFVTAVAPTPPARRYPSRSSPRPPQVMIEVGDDLQVDHYIYDVETIEF